MEMMSSEVLVPSLFFTAKCNTWRFHMIEIIKMLVHRYNLYDRSPRVPFPASESNLFYKGVRRLAVAISRLEGRWSLLLEPGTVAFINNWRVLHGRSAYLGQRSMCGAYIAMGDLLSRARCLQLIQWPQSQYLQHLFEKFLPIHQVYLCYFVILMD